MYTKAVDLLNPFVKRFKIREFDGKVLFSNKTNDLIEKVLSTQKEVIISVSIPAKLPSCRHRVLHDAEHVTEK